MSTDPVSGLTIGIDIGGTSVRAGLIDSAGTIHATLRAATPATAQETEDLFTRLITELAAQAPVAGVGLAVAGFISADRTLVRFAPHLAWRNADVPRRIADRVGLPVVMDHDVNAAAWAEYALGTAAGSPSALLVALGTGIGAGFVVNGEIYRGAHGVAPELGHLMVVPGGRACPCGKTGCLERYCSGTALAATVVEWAAGDPARWTGELAATAVARPQEITGAMVGRAAMAGDDLATAAVADMARWLGVGLSIVADVLDPELIVIGGGVSALADLLLPAAVDTARELITGAAHRVPARVQAAALGDTAGMIGASLLARG